MVLAATNECNRAGGITHGLGRAGDLDSIKGQSRTLSAEVPTLFG